MNTKKKIKNNLSPMFEYNEINLSDGFNNFENIYDEDILMHIGEPKKKYKSKKLQ